MCLHSGVNRKKAAEELTKLSSPAARLHIILYIVYLYPFRNARYPSKISDAATASTVSFRFFP